MFGIDNLLGDLLVSFVPKQGKNSGYRSSRRASQIRSIPTYSPSYIPSNKKNDSIRDAKEAMKYSGINKFKF